MLALVIDDSRSMRMILKHEYVLEPSTAEVISDELSLLGLPAAA